ncbi:MAG TPA: hypothetical protein VGL91_19635, partial [Acidobacteriota bacterium]
MAGEPDRTACAVAGVWTFWRDGRWAVSRTIFHRAGDAPPGVSPNSAASRTKARYAGLAEEASVV